MPSKAPAQAMLQAHIYLYISRIYCKAKHWMEDMMSSPFLANFSRMICLSRVCHGNVLLERYIVTQKSTVMLIYYTCHLVLDVIMCK